LGGTGTGSRFASKQEGPAPSMRGQHERAVRALHAGWASASEPRAGRAYRHSGGAKLKNGWMNPAHCKMKQTSAEESSPLLN
jgi:hypothetical protein